MLSATAGVTLRCAGEGGLLVEWENAISPEINARVHRLAARLARSTPEGVLELVPAYRSLMVYFDPLTVSRPVLSKAVLKLLELEENGEKDGGAMSRLLRVPVCYGGEFGPDLEEVARRNGLSPEEVVALHSSGTYRVYMLGFTPGFAYLGGMSPRLATPRLEEPRTHIPRGSVGIAGSQTGVYPIESPGGWRLIGRTPLLLFSPQSELPFLFAAGDALQFVPISPEEFRRLDGAVRTGAYVPEFQEIRTEGMLS